MNEFLRRHKPLVWVVMSILIVAGDFLSGPAIQFPILFVLPVVLATRYSGKWWGVSLAVILPFTRLLLFFSEGATGSLFILLFNSGIRIAVLGALALLIDRQIRLQKEVEMLELFLPICSFCKKIRREDDTWTQVEAYFTEKDKVKFSHGLCPDCLEKHYGDILKTKG